MINTPDLTLNPTPTEIISPPSDVTITKFIGSKILTDDEYDMAVIQINRVTKVVTGGRRFAFSIVVVVGDYKSRVGLGKAKAHEIADGLKRARKNAIKNMFVVPINQNKTIPHAIIGKFNSSKILIKPAKLGTGIIAGGAVRSLLAISGIQNIYAKKIRGKSSVNMVKATITALQQMHQPKLIWSVRHAKP